MDEKRIIKLVMAAVAEPMADQLKEIRKLRKEVDHLKRAYTLTRALERGRVARERVQAAEADDE